MRVAMKGFELYSWREGDTWMFSLVEGTNRLKTSAEIKSDVSRMAGVGRAREVLERLPPGETVSWGHSFEDFELPSRADVETLEQAARSRGVQLFY